MHPDALEASITYLVRDDERYKVEKPYVSLVPFLNDKTKFTNTESEDHVMSIVNVRGREKEFSLDRNGFEYTSYISTQRPSHGIVNPSHPYVQEMADFLKNHLKAKTVTVYDGNTRRVGDPKHLQASTYAHIDHSQPNAHWRMKQILAEKGVDKLPERWQFINIWVPITGPVLSSPISVCDYQSTEWKDLAAVDSVFPHRVMEVYHTHYNPKHQWYYLDQQDINEVLIMKTYDSEGDSSRYCLHSAIMNEKPVGTIVRESIELRSLVTY